MPQRIQRKRTKGWRMPEGALSVTRPGPWGNPFPWQGAWIIWISIALGYKADTTGRRAVATLLHRSWLTGEALTLGPYAGSEQGGMLEFANGFEVSFSDHVRGIAATASRLVDDVPTIGAPPSDFAELAGYDLVCWCPLGQPCHADVLLEVANA